MANAVNYIPGTPGQLVKTDGVSGLSGDLLPRNAGAINLLSSQLAAGAGTIAYTNLAAPYLNYRIVVTDLIVNTGVSNLRLGFSTNNGTSYDTATANYVFFYRMFDVTGTTVTSQNNGSTTAGYLNVLPITSTGARGMCIIDICRPLSGQIVTSAQFWSGANTSARFGHMLGIYTPTTVVNAMRLHVNGASVTGSFALYGML